MRRSSWLSSFSLDSCCLIYNLNRATWYRIFTCTKASTHFETYGYSRSLTWAHVGTRSFTLPHVGMRSFTLPHVDMRSLRAITDYHVHSLYPTRTSNCIHQNESELSGPKWVCSSPSLTILWLWDDIVVTVWCTKPLQWPWRLGDGTVSFLTYSINYW